MNDEKKRRLWEIIFEFEKDINAYHFKFFNREILRECGIAGLLTVKDLFAQVGTGLDGEIDGFLQDYKLDEYQNLYDKSGTTLISYNEDNLLDRFEVPDGVTRIGDKAFKGNETIQ
ncbi:MAG TPA: hypothetical protein IAB05_00995, partial [Candidatus Stercoripulliclostridium merdigallinarum]|nr:hypothetical protein [Candidatus Stercoripulliclostridium merdigallinarum]